MGLDGAPPPYRRQLNAAHGSAIAARVVPAMSPQDRKASAGRQTDINARNNRPEITRDQACRRCDRQYAYAEIRTRLEAAAMRPQPR